VKKDPSKKKKTITKRVTLKGDLGRSPRWSPREVELEDLGQEKRVVRDFFSDRGARREKYGSNTPTRRSQ